MKVFLLLIVVCYFVVVVSCGFQNNWEQKPGVIATSGEVATVLSNPTFILLSVNGDQRTTESKLARVAAYHAVISLPNPPFSLSGTGTSRDGAVSRTRLTWKTAEKPEREQFLDIFFNGDLGTIKIGDEQFYLSSGNLFLIRIKPDWSVTTEALPGKLTQVSDSRSVLSTFKSFAKESEIGKLSLP
jgi:hypothetical protein